MASSASPPIVPKLGEDRLSFLKTVASPSIVPVIENLQQQSLSSNSTAYSKIIANTPAALVQELALANAIADLSDHHPQLTKALIADPDVSSIRDIARKYNATKLTALLAGERSEGKPPAKEVNGLQVNDLNSEQVPGELSKQTHKADLSAFAGPTKQDSVTTEKRLAVDKSTPAIVIAPQPAVANLQRRLFNHEPSATLARMVQDGEIPIANSKLANEHSTNASLPNPNPVKDGVVKFFDNNPDLNLRQTSIVTVLSEPQSLIGVSPEHHNDVIHNLKVLQRTQALTNAPEVIPALITAGLTSAFQLAQIPRSNFVANHSDELGGLDIATDIHVHATNTVVRNDHALTSLLQTMRGTGIAMIDGHETRDSRIKKAKALAESLPEKVDLERLFGNMDFCDCDDCNSVTSPAAYFVELLQFLRNNNLYPKDQFTGQTTIAKTPLEVLFKRRPDLGKLQLTCANTNTVLPYIDLANEVMESFVVHLKTFQTASDSIVEIDVWNADSNAEGLGGSSGELLAQPQNTNYQAYCMLKDAVYPATKLPFNQPVEATRLFLEFLGTSRAELGERLKGTYAPLTVTTRDVITDPAPQPHPCTVTPSSSRCSSSDSSSSSDETSACDTDEESSTRPSDPPAIEFTGTAISKQDQDRLRSLHEQALSRADDAEILLLTEEEYIILTKEAFWAKSHFDIRHGTITTTAVYQQRIGVKPEYAYWGVDYTSTNDMQSLDEGAQTGLAFVKLQLLPRAGIVYSDLVDLVKTEFINPYMPQGKDKVIMESIRLSYRFLQSKLLPNATHKWDRYGPMVDYLFCAEWQHILQQHGVTDITTLFADEVKAAGKCKIHHHHRRHHHNDEHGRRPCLCRLKEAIRKWLCKKFEKIGKIVVLESILEQPKLWFEAYVVVPKETPKKFLATSTATMTTAAERTTVAEPTAGITTGTASGPGAGSTAGFGTGGGTGDFGPVTPDGPIQGTILGRLLSDGRIAASQPDQPLKWDESRILATVGLDGVVLLPDKVKWFEKNPNTIIQLNNGTIIGKIDEDSKLIVDKDGGVVRWVGPQDDCDISKVRLRQLDGCPVSLATFDRMHRFLRLWRKLGWVMVELDAALRVLGKPPPPPPQPSKPPCPPSTIDTAPQAADEDVDWISFEVSCSSGNCGQQTCDLCQQQPTKSEESVGKRGKKKAKTASTAPEITPVFLHQLVALKKLVDLTGLSLLELLAFWGSIDIYGDPPSLYAQLFLTHNILGIDTVFAADANGNYLVATPSAKIKDHTQVILAAFQLKPADYVALIQQKMLISSDLTVDSISVIYRYALVAKILGVKPAKVDHVFDTLQINAFESAEKALELITLWNKISNAGFTFQQLDYVFTTTDDDLRPVGPSERSLLQVTVTLYNGLNDIDAQHPDINDVSQSTSAIVLANAQLLFSTDVGAQILAFLEGKRPFTTAAPSGLVLTIPSELTAKIKYADGEKAQLQVTGQLTDDETAKAKALSGNPQWALAINRTARQAATFLKATLSAVFPISKTDDTNNALLKGDIAPPSDPAAPNNDTSPGKRLYFLKYFIPFLRSKLADKLIADTISTATSLDSQLTQDLLSHVLKDTTDPHINALDGLKNIKNDKSASSNVWNGYLIPPTTDNYTLVAEGDNQPQDMMIEGVMLSFENHFADDDLLGLWASKPLRLTGGRLYNIQLNGLLPKNFNWKTDRTQITQVPASSLLANHITENLKALFVVVWKCGILINGFTLTDEEILYLQDHGADFGKLDWNAIQLPQWNRIADYITLKQSLPKLEVSLIDFFTWASRSTATKGLPLVSQISNITLWQPEDITSAISAKNFGLDDPANFRNEINLIKLQQALDISTKIGVGIDLLFNWAKPQIDFWKSHAIAENIRNAIRSSYKLSDWEVAIKSTYDQLRQAQSDALSAYLVVQPELVLANVIDADSLFEFLLIDVQMCPCMETSRMKQATSSVQLFIQRCMLGLELDNGVLVDALDRGRWDWMQRYRVWEANRKVYLYPENWIQPSLRDDKSAIYLQFESELMQKDLSTDSIVDIMKNYLFGLDEIANLEVDALHVEEGALKTDSKKIQAIKIHVFARTRQSPYKFYYRLYDMVAAAWQPWQDMQLDITHYDVEKGKKPGGTATPPIQSRPDGFYLVPFVYNGRLLLGLPQFMKVQLAQDPPDRSFADIGSHDKATSPAPEEYWEIKMGLTELRNGKWTAKTITADSISEGTTRPAQLPPIGSYQFVTRNISDDAAGLKVVIDVYRLDATGLDKEARASAVGTFSFTGSQFGKDPDGPLPPSPPGQTLHWSDFQFQRDRKVTTTGTDDFLHGRVMFPLQGKDRTPTGLVYGEGELMVRYPISEVDRTSLITYYTGNKTASQNFYHSFVHDLLSQVTRTDKLDDLFGYFATGPGLTDTDTQKEQDKKFDAYGGDEALGADFPTYNELSRPYSLYNWELGFHAAMTLVDRLLQNQQFDLALSMCHYVFNPLSKSGNGSSGTIADDKRYWMWKPFKEVDSMNSMANLFASLRPNTSDPVAGQINMWRDHPFQPHVLARLRPVAYMKFVVMKYIEILIAYGDYFFRQNTLEMIPMAIQLYVLASHIYGRRGQKIPKRGKTEVQTYNSLLNKWDAFDNAMVDLELAFPFSNQTTTSTGLVNGEVGLANIWGFATTRYFCIPNNPQLEAVRDLIDDRLFKIRHCEDINGVVRQLPLYEPPIDPGLLVAAAAAGLSLSSVLNDLNSPLPNFRFTRLLHKALEMCKELKKLGKSFVAAKERKDVEALSALRQTHESTIQNMVMDQKKLSLDEANKAHDSLQQTRKVPEYRMQHTLKQLGEDLGSIPSVADVEQEFNELADQIEAPIVDSGMKLVAAEKEEIEKAIKSLNLKPIVNAIETAASELHILPTLNAHASPFGVGIASCWGPPNIAKGIQGAAKAYQMVADWLSHQSSNVSRAQSFVKQNQARVKEANTAGHEIKTIDKQIVTQQVRIAVHQQDITNQQKQIDHAQEVGDFLQDKYTKTELYTWLDQSVSQIYYQTYTMAYELAKKAEAAFQFERGLSTSNFIKFGYWETNNSGLMSGERLFLGLKDLEAAYLETRGYDFEVSKYVSLRRINPLGLLKLREEGNCDFAMPEVLFDMDFPGHYQRKLRSVAVTLQCATDPFTNINCTLRLMAHKFRVSGIAQGKGDYPEKTDQDDGRFTTTHIPVSSIAVSTADNDSGVFELDFKGDRFMPFEGAGAISQWHLELNGSFRQFDYESITDVIIRLQYTSLDGGNALGQAASGAVGDYIKHVVDVSDTEGLYAIFDVPHDFPTEWAAFQSSPTPRVLTLNNVNEKLPMYAKSTPADKIVTKDVWIATEAALVPGSVSVAQGNAMLSFTKAPKNAGTMTVLHSTDPCSIKNWAVSIGDAAPTMRQFWVLARYSLQ